MPALSTLSNFTNYATLSTGDTVSASEHNTVRSDTKTRLDNFLTILRDLEKNFAGTTEPTDKPEGKVWVDTNSDPAVLKYYKDGAGNLHTIASLERDQTFSGANTLELADGSAGDPSLSFDSDEDNGIYRVGADVLGVSRGLEIGPGGNSDRGRVPCVLYTDTTEVGNVGSGEDDLMSYTLPGGTLANDGDSIIVEGVFIGNGTDDIRIFLYIDGTARETLISVERLDTGSVYIKMVRLSSTTYRLLGWKHKRHSADGEDFEGVDAGNADVTVSNFNNNDIVLKFTGENQTDTSNDAVTQKFMGVEFKPAGP